MLFSIVTSLLFVVFIERSIFSSSRKSFVLTTIHGLDHDLMQLLKTSDRKMVMYNIASNLNGIFRRIGKAT